jgi:L-lactate dehydrogenase (cytochrome)
VNEFTRLVGRQLKRDLAGAPAAVRGRLDGTGRMARCGTVDEVRRAARLALPKVIFDFVDGAAGDEVTARRNREDFAGYELLPGVFRDVSEVDLSTTVLGRPVALPILGAPMGLLGLIHPEGELALARALHRAGSVYAVSAMASYSVEDMAARAPGPLWFQLYVWRDRGLVVELVDRARAAGCEALVLTVDVPAAAGRDRDRRNGFGIPPRLTLRSAAEGAVRPRWSYRFVRHAPMGMGNVAGRGVAGGDPVAITDYITRQFDPSVTWDDLVWFREQWEGPLLIKGVLDGADAREAVRRGADGIIVSNHGGRQLDHAPSTIRALPAVLDAVGGEAEVLLDGGIRRGADVMKALALGARACLVGRPLVYGLGAGGEAGVDRVLALLEAELRTAMALAGCSSTGALDTSRIRARNAAIGG